MPLSSMKVKWLALSRRVNYWKITSRRICLALQVRDYMEPLLTIKANELRARAAEIMSEHGVEFIAVTNQNGVLLGVASLGNLNS